MRTIIAGSRTITNYELVCQVIEQSGFDIETVICGEARGIDLFGKQYAYENNLFLESYPADWLRHGKKAGYIRNEEMAKHSDSLIVVWDGKSCGTATMIKLAKQYGLHIFMYDADKCQSYSLLKRKD